ncbi:glycosyltransferase family 4 protein [Sporolactobacillus sp. Y61]|uniref:Glycosyltransferase family 4 protein n=1 Tax=Sporolactobacillus sp. Y61 TaxID=3160863 RepID=A0AAU8IHL5_9BACL
MKILFMNNLLPYPLDNGGKIKTYNTLKALSVKHEIDLLAFINHEEDRKYVTELSGVCRKIHVIPKTVIKDASMLHFIIDYVSSLFSPLPYVIKKFSSKVMKEKLIQFQQEKHYDLIYVNHLSMMVYNKYFHSKVLLDQQNVESLIFKRIIGQMKNKVKRLFGKVEYVKLKKFEKDMLYRADRVIALSQTDKNEFVNMLSKTRKQIDVIPIHVDAPFLDFYPRKDNKIRLLFMGTMSWYPNKEGVIWFLKNCFLNLNPDKYDLYICGANPPREIEKYRDKKNVTVTGYVKDINEYIRICDLAIVPLFIGSGQRVKIIESFAKGLPVVSTSIGAEGLITDQQNILIADQPDTFLKSIKLLATHPELRQKIKRNARTVYEQYYSNASLSRALNKVFLDMGVQ